jgi:hypothetical protein
MSPACAPARIPSFPNTTLFDLGFEADHDDDEAGRLRDLARRTRDPRAERPGPPARSRHRIAADHLEAFGEQMPRHRVPHLAQADEAYRFYGCHAPSASCLLPQLERRES